MISMQFDKKLGINECPTTLQFSAKLAEFLSRMLPKITIIFILVTRTFSVNLMPGLPLPNDETTMQPELDQSFRSAKLSEDLDLSVESSKLSAFSSANDEKWQICCKNGCIYYPKYEEREAVMDCKPRGGPCRDCTTPKWAPKTCWTVPNCELMGTV